MLVFFSLVNFQKVITFSQEQFFVSFRHSKNVTRPVSSLLYVSMELFVIQRFLILRQSNSSISVYSLCLWVLRCSPWSWFLPPFLVTEIFFCINFLLQIFLSFKLPLLLLLLFYTLSCLGILGWAPYKQNLSWGPCAHGCWGREGARKCSWSHRELWSVSAPQSCHLCTPMLLTDWLCFSQTPPPWSHYFNLSGSSPKGLKAVSCWQPTCKAAGVSELPA